MSLQVKTDVDIRADVEEGRKMYSTKLECVCPLEYYKQCRSVSKRFQVKPGTYVIIPSTTKYNEEEKFLLRIFIDQTVEIVCCKELTVNKENLVSVKGTLTPSSILRYDDGVV